MRQRVRRLIGRSGPYSLLLASVALVAAGCASESGAGGDGIDPERALRDTLGLSPRATVHRVYLGGERDRERIAPASVDAEEGDYLLFETIDGRIHELGFAVDSLTPEVAGFLAETRQTGVPPLLTRGDRFLVDLEDAPAGRYVFRARTVGEPVFGVVRVDLPPPP